MQREVLALQALIKRYIWWDAAGAIKVGANRGQKAAAWQVLERGWKCVYRAVWESVMEAVWWL